MAKKSKIVREKKLLINIQKYAKKKEFIYWRAFGH